MTDTSAPTATTGPAPHGADSEVGRLRTVLLHRPGKELKRLTPRNNDKLLFDAIPWVSRAQEEHDAFAEALRSRDVEVLYLTDLLTETLARGRPASGPSPRPWASSTWVRPCAATSARCWARPVRPRAHDVPHRGHPQRRGPRRVRPGHLAAGPRRLPDRPAAQPALHPRLQRVGARPGRDHLADHARPQARDPADRADLHRPPPVRRHAAHPRLARRAHRGRRRAAARPGCDRGRGRGADHPGRAPSGWPGRSWPTASRTPCSRCRSRRSERPCTSTPSARWSTSTRS